MSAVEKAASSLFASTSIPPRAASSSTSSSSSSSSSVSDSIRMTGFEIAFAIAAAGRASGTRDEAVAVEDDSWRAEDECVLPTTVRGRAAPTVAEVVDVRPDVLASFAGSLPFLPSGSVDST
jgi:hypothetical protein